jgi:NADH-quinone oxidoreductase subunit L
MSMMTLFWMIPLLPLLGAAINGFAGKRLGKAFSSSIAAGVVLGSLILGIKAFSLMQASADFRLELHAGNWIQADSLSVPFGIVFDPLTCSMSLIVTGIGFLIHIYSIGYMGEEKSTARYFSYLNLFIFFMLVLVLGSSLPLIFVGWEGVGLCSYLLIGYYFKTDHAPAAGYKAFIVNRVGDFGMVIGMMALFAAFGTLTIGDILGATSDMPPELGFGALTFATLMIFLGASGKSAQLPLHVWLPDAMAGPTPVSALIHAATMVTSGIVLICRLAPLFQLTPITMSIIAWVGAATALFAASVALVQRDIKKVLAFSTISQLGYMFLGLGAAGFAAGFFHLFAHAWFKALLFLGAGSVIASMHHEQDIFKMGALRRKMPITFLTMCFAALCIIGFPGTSGFASKDEILLLAYLKSPFLWMIGQLGACFTAFYVVRMMTLVFLGSPKESSAFGQARESGIAMAAPMIILAIGSLLAAAAGWPEAFGGSFAIGKFLEPSLSFGHSQPQAASQAGHGLAWALAAASAALGLGSAWLAWKTYKNGISTLAEDWPRLHRALLKECYADAAIKHFFAKPALWLGEKLFWASDVIAIDGFGINMPAALARLSGDIAALLQTGRVRNYLLTMGFGMAALIAIFLFR